MTMQANAATIAEDIGREFLTLCGAVTTTRREEARLAASVEEETALLSKAHQRYVEARDALYAFMQENVDAGWQQ